MRRLARFAPVVLLLAVWPGATLAQTGRGVGVVTTLAGTVTVARVALPGPRPLHFKDDVFVRDHIATAEKSVVRVLLGGKALVTVRELSSLTIKEETGRSTVDLTSGKIAMGVLRQRMRPGEVIEIRTPNAIAAIRGTVLVVELIPAPGGTSGQPSYTTKVHVLHGLVEVSDPNNPGAPVARGGRPRIRRPPLGAADRGRAGRVHGHRHHPRAGEGARGGRVPGSGDGRGGGGRGQ
jgi:hypothetical protein